MKKHEAYSVLITGDKGNRGTGTLFYQEGSSFFYVFTCAHVIYLSESVTINIIISLDDIINDYKVDVTKDRFRFSPIDEVTVISESTTVHTSDIAVIKCDKGDIPLMPTGYMLVPMTDGEKIHTVGYPECEDISVYYQQMSLDGEVMRIDSNADYFMACLYGDNLNSADREAELKGFSGAPVWDKQSLDDNAHLLGGIIASGVGCNISLGRVKVMNSKLLAGLMRDEFGIEMQYALPGVPEKDIAPGYIGGEISADHKTVLGGWIENECCKAQTYIDNLQLKKAIDKTRATIENKEFSKCSNEQKYSIYSLLLMAYRLSREYDVYDAIVNEMHALGIYSERENLTEAVRYFEAMDFSKAEEYITKALSENPDGNQERVMALAVRAAKDSNSNISILSEVLGPRDQLLIKPAGKKEEESLYEVLGFVLGNIFKETGRALRCLNRAFKISGNHIILETLGITYYLHSLRDAFIEEGSDRIDPLKIDIASIELARDAFLRVFSSADEMWMKGTFRRAGLLIFKCFYFLHDNFRIYKHYQDAIKYIDFPDNETKRDIQKCYLDIAIQNGPVNIDDYDALTDYDRDCYQLMTLLAKPMKQIDKFSGNTIKLSEADLLAIIKEGEEQLAHIISEQEGGQDSIDGIHSSFINIYGYGILKYHWNAIPEVRRHYEAVQNARAREAFDIYIDELHAENPEIIEERYHALFDRYKDMISFNEWSHFYIRHEMVEKTKALYDSVFNERRYLIHDQAEYFYRCYIDFIMARGLNVAPALRCFVDHRDDFKDPFIAMSFEMDLMFYTCTFNNPDRMLENVKILFDEGLLTDKAYEEKSLIINMLNCRLSVAEQFAGWAHGGNPLNGSIYERMLLILKGAHVYPNNHWHSMKASIHETNILDIYHGESRLRNPEDILRENNTAASRAIVVDLWTLYYLVNSKLQSVLSRFRTIYVTHISVSMALQEINQVNDDDIRQILYHLQKESNVRILSPSLEQQLLVRSPETNYTEVHSACLLAQELNLPAVIGEFRYPIPEEFRSRVIRPTEIKAVIDYILGSGNPG